MAEVVVMPKLGLTMEKGSVVTWMVNEGDPVHRGMLIAEIESEKTVYELEAESDGVLLKILVPEGVQTKVGIAIAVIGQEGGDISALIETAPTSATDAATTEAPVQTQEARAVVEETARRLSVSPAARKLAAELGVELTNVAGTGPGDRITLEDVRATASRSEDKAATTTSVAANSGAEDARGGVAKEIPYSGIRRTIGEHVTASSRLSATVHYYALADVQELKEFLDQTKQKTSPPGVELDPDIVITAVAVRATALALETMPRFNASLDGDVIKVWKSINVGVAVALSKGLIVPVVKEANRKTLMQIAHEVRDLAERARENKLLPDEVSGGTFTVTTLGPYGSVDFFSPIINQPELAILGVGRMRDTVVALDGVPTTRATMGLSLACDHRVLDGGPAADFMRALLDNLAGPFDAVV